MLVIFWQQQVEGWSLTAYTTEMVIYKLSFSVTESIQEM